MAAFEQELLAEARGFFDRTEQDGTDGTLMYGDIRNLYALSNGQWLVLSRTVELSTTRRTAEVNTAILYDQDPTAEPTAEVVAAAKFRYPQKTDSPRFDSTVALINALQNPPEPEIAPVFRSDAYIGSRRAREGVLETEREIPEATKRRAQTNAELILNALREGSKFVDRVAVPIVPGRQGGPLPIRRASARV